VAQLVARSARSVVAVDLSPRMVAYAREQAAKAGLKNLEFREGDLETPPLDAGSMDVVLFSQALHHAANPPSAIVAAHRVLRPGGRLVILDLKQHHFDAARELYSDVWLGFSETELARWQRKAGFQDIAVRIVERETQKPNFQSLLSCARK
jgi:ArsR family transcriptional regulator